MKRVVIALALTGLAVCSGTDRQADRPPSEVRFGGRDAVLHVDVADTADTRREGLMGVEELPEDQGMAFVFDEPVTSPFWMKDTLIPLSVAFVDQAGTVIGMRDMQPCEAGPCPSYGIDEPYMLAIEANLGWFGTHGVEIGDRAELRVMPYG